MNGIAIVRKLRNCSCVMDIEKKKKPNISISENGNPPILDTDAS